MDWGCRYSRGVRVAWIGDAGILEGEGVAYYID